MWKYLILNSLWFCILFFVHFYGNKRSQRFIFFFILTLAVAIALDGSMDPIAWFFYLGYSLVITHTLFPFKQWVFARSVALDEELLLMADQCQRQRAVLEIKEKKTDAMNQEANKISHLYDKAKEMSQSLDLAEVFVILGEALAKNFKFQSVKIIFLDKEEVYEVTYDLFNDRFDRELFLKDKENVKGEVFPRDKKMLEILLKSHRSFVSDKVGEPLVVAFPIFLDQKLTAALLILGMESNESPLLPILIESFISDTQRLKLYDRVETLAITDGLTGVAVRRYLMERFEGEVDRCRRFGLKVSFLMIDVDDFKQFNDEYGHLVGDVVLKQVAATIKTNTREIDLVGRYGGEEFGVLLVETDEPATLVVAERIRRSVEQRSFRAYDEELKVTVSIGCSTYSPALGDANLLVEAADSALYQAKRQGKDRVCVYGP